MEDVLSALTQRLPNRTSSDKAKGLGEAVLSDNGKITAQYLYPHLEKFFKPTILLLLKQVHLQRD